MIAISFELNELVDYDCGACTCDITGCPTQAFLGNGEMVESWRKKNLL